MSKIRVDFKNTFYEFVALRRQECYFLLKCGILAEYGGVGIYDA